MGSERHRGLLLVSYLNVSPDDESRALWSRRAEAGLCHRSSMLLHFAVTAEAHRTDLPSPSLLKPSTAVYLDAHPLHHAAADPAAPATPRFPRIVHASVTPAIPMGRPSLEAVHGLSGDDIVRLVWCQFDASSLGTTGQREVDREVMDG
ncbi:unnamed protein product [Arctogadus glacialis]